VAIEAAASTRASTEDVRSATEPVAIHAQNLIAINTRATASEAVLARRRSAELDSFDAADLVISGLMQAGAGRADP
jgi:hypothetical protein